jgi:hypothetical protein
MSKYIQDPRILRGMEKQLRLRQARLSIIDPLVGRLIGTLYLRSGIMNAGPSHRKSAACLWGKVSIETGKACSRVRDCHYMSTDLNGC